MDQLIRQVLHDRYEIRSLLGRKTGRRTFLATDLTTRSPVVIKLLLFGRDFTWDDLKLFEREAETLKSLDHPAIPQYLDFFEIETKLGKGFALVQTYIEARSLQDWLPSGRTFSEADLKAIARQLLHILDYLHRRQPAVVHRDIKPSNILLGDRSGNSPGQVYLVDFGSVQTAQQGGTVTIVGTYGYMPPEQFSGRTKPASDLYALGATLIYLATGQHPSELPQQELRILFADRVNLTPTLVDWLQWLTEPSLDLRLESASKALAALEKPRLRKDPAAIVKKPPGCKVQVIHTRQKLEILIPPQGFSSGMIWMSVITIPAVWLIVSGYITAFSYWGLSIITSPIALIGAWCLGMCLWVIWVILFALFGRTKLCITQNEISLIHEYFGLSCLSLRVRTASRQSIRRIALTSPSYKTNFVGTTTAAPSQLNIWAEMKNFKLTSQGSLSKTDRRRVLTDADLEWLAQELSDWLKLPVTRL